MRYLSWLFIVIGVLLAGYGAYDYYSARIAQHEAAQEWTSTPPPAADDSEAPVPDKSPGDAQPYFDPYRHGDTVAKLILPHLNTPLYVVEGTDQKALRKGPGHMPGTALPGVEGNCVIAGHRDTHFRALQAIRPGDEVEIETKYGKFRYKVEGSEIVLPTNVKSLYPTRKGVLHLVTCYPFEYVGHAPKRMVIEAVLMHPQSDDQVAPASAGGE